MDSVMIDLETLDNTATSAIISIGACKFDPEANDDKVIGQTLHLHVDWDDAIQNGTVSGDTLKWWIKQNDESRNAIINAPTVKLATALEMLSMFFKGSTYIWGNGSTFDISILENAYGRNNAPWNFFDVRDVRTVVHLADGMLNKNDFPFIGIKHDASDDAVHQAIYVSAMWKLLRCKEPTHIYNISTDDDPAAPLVRVIKV